MLQRRMQYKYYIAIYCASKFTADATCNNIHVYINVHIMFVSVFKPTFFEKLAMEFVLPMQKYHTGEVGQKFWKGIWFRLFSRTCVEKNQNAVI